MRIISPKKLRKNGERRADCTDAPMAWYRVATAADRKSLDDVRRTYPHADSVGNETVFNIKGNNHRPIAAIRYNTGKTLIREILTHAEYDRGGRRNR